MSEPRRWPAITIDVLDGAVGLGCLLFVAGAAVLHWGLAVMLLGLALVGGAVWLNRRT